MELRKNRKTKELGLYLSVRCTGSCAVGVLGIEQPRLQRLELPCRVKSDEELLQPVVYVPLLVAFYRGGLGAVDSLGIRNDVSDERSNGPDEPLP
jgi:hypothetical protein